MALLDARPHLYIEGDNREASMDRSSSAAFPPFLGAAVLVCLGALFFAVGTRTRDFDFDEYQRSVHPGEERVDAVVIEHSEGFPIGRITEVEWPEIAASDEFAYVDGWVGVRGETIELIVWAHPDLRGAYLGRVPPPPGEMSSSLDYPGLALMLGSGLVMMGVAIAIRDFRSRADRGEGSEAP